jgi:serine/threonine protein kinase
LHEHPVVFRMARQNGVSPAELEQSVRECLYGEQAALAVVPSRGPRRDPRCADLSGSLAGGRYRLLERVAATVYRARDERLERDVAVKLIAERFVREPRFVRRFRQEAQLCARVAHPNVVAVFDAGVVPRDFIVMELVEGLDADALLKRRGPTPAEAVDVIAQVCEALAHVHDHGVIHQDVAPGNILIRQRDGTAKLADFGLACASPDHAARPLSGGTPGYIAPEILRGERPSPRSDLYSLGVVAHRLLERARPDLPPGLGEAVRRATRDDPGARHESVWEFGAELRQQRRRMG